MLSKVHSKSLLLLALALIVSAPANADELLPTSIGSSVLTSGDSAVVTSADPTSATAVSNDASQAAAAVSNDPTAGYPTFEKPSMKEVFVNGNIAISNWFDSVAEGIDLFLMGEDIAKERNETNVKLTNTSYMTEGQGYLNETTLSVNPRFPNLEKYWNLKFTTYDEQAERGTDKTYLRQSPREQNYGASVGLFRKLGQVRVIFQPRIELQDPLQVSHSLAFESIAEMRGFKINPKLELFASASRGTGTFEALNFNFTLTDIYSLTLINEGEYLDKLHLYSVTNGFSVGQSLSSRAYLSYSLLFFSSNQPSYHMDGYSAAVSWYHMIYRKVLDFQLTPHLDFNKTDDFHGRAGLTFAMTVNF